MAVLNFIATVILIFLFSNYDDNDFARELHDGWFSKDEIGDLLDMDEEEVNEAIWENDHDSNYPGYYDF